MTLKECYQILGVSQSASLEEVKRVYRRRAFELHPDLNPGIPDASSQFQKLNEAYVILSKLVSVREEREKKKTSAHATTPGTDKTTGAASAQTASSEATSTAQEEKTKSEQSRTSEQTRTEKTSTSTSSATESTSAQTGGQAKASASSKAEETTTHTSSESEQHKRHATRDGYTEQQEVLQDILSDPFARRVFEDIYSEIRKKTPTQPPPPKSPPSLRQKATPSRMSELLNWGQRSIHLDFSKGIGGALKGWLRNQIDEEQLFQLPAHRLVPGARIRLQIRHGFSDEITTLDVTLPPDFKPEKPIRLKGMGKKLGQWQGDLYLRFSAKTASS